MFGYIACMSRYGDRLFYFPNKILREISLLFLLFIITWIVFFDRNYWSFSHWYLFTIERSFKLILALPVLYYRSYALILFNVSLFLHLPHDVYELVPSSYATLIRFFAPLRRLQRDHFITQLVIDVPQIVLLVLFLGHAGLFTAARVWSDGRVCLEGGVATTAAGWIYDGVTVADPRCISAYDLRLGHGQYLWRTRYLMLLTGNTNPALDCFLFYLWDRA